MSEEKLRDYLKRVTLDLRKTHRELKDLKCRQREPIAIVGIGCRFPGGVSSAEGLWQLLERGEDGVSNFPEDRGWDLQSLYSPDPTSVGTSYVREGGFLHDATGFDADFFAISPREALAMDPQQRVLLETAWEACEHAGVDPHTLRATRTGVYLGVGSYDYGALVAERLEDPDGYRVTGSASSVASGRIAYTLGLEGPAVSLDTACSSSLVALHLACQALRRGECSQALAGGVTVMPTPHMFVDFSRQRGLAPDGRCKSFADAADGTAWSEGVGVLLVERLSLAHELGHRVLATIRGSAVNQDGASNGLTAPSGASQQRVIEDALSDAGFSAHEVDAVEAHGTGTVLGDPIEVQALLATYGRDRSTLRPLRLGSIKSNIGHAQLAAGVAGVIKMTMALRHETLPRTLHVEKPSTRVDWSGGAIALVTEPLPWPRVQEPRRAAVSSFGVGGTNAHLILEEAPVSGVGVVEDRLSGSLAGTGTGTGTGAGVAVVGVGVPVPWVLSAKSEVALREQARRLLDHMLANSEQESGDIGLSLAVRPALERRAVVVGENREELLAGVDAIAAGQSHGGVSGGVVGDGFVAGSVVRGRGGVAFLFAGQGSQRVGMGVELRRSLPVFADVFDGVVARFDGLLEGSLSGVLSGVEGSSEAGLIDLTSFAQPALFALEVALFEQVVDWGVRPDYLLGHSVGELAAACVAGVFSLDDACRLVAARGRLMAGLPGGGAMLAVGVSQGEALVELAGREDRVSLAAVNGPSSVVVSGERDVVGELAEYWEGLGRKTRLLRVSHAFHSHRMDGMLEEFRALAGELSFEAPSIPIVSNLTGEVVDAQRICTPDYWVEHVRQTVRFADGVASLRARGVNGFLELGPGGALSAACRECLVGEGEGEDGVVVAPLLRAGRGELEAFLAGLGELWVGGVGVDWSRAFVGSGARRVDLPTYAFQRERYWLEGSPAGVGSMGSSTRHPLLGAAVAVAADDSLLFSGTLSLRTHPWLADHVIGDSVLLAGTALVELVLHAGRTLGCEELQELTLERPLRLGEQPVELQLSVGAGDEWGSREVQVHSRPLHRGEQSLDSGVSWERHATGVLAGPDIAPGVDGVLGGQAQALLDGSWPPAGAQPVSVEELYEDLAARGLSYGPSFQGLRVAWRRGEELFAEVELPGGGEGVDAYVVHPALLDAALHCLACDSLGGDLIGAGEDASVGVTGGRVAIPFAWRGVRLLDGAGTSLRVRLAPVEGGGVSLLALDEQGGIVALVESLVLRALSAYQRESLSSERAEDDGLLCVDWVEQAPGVLDGEVGLLLVGERLGGLSGRPGASIVELERSSEPEGVRSAVNRVLSEMLAWLDGEQRSSEGQHGEQRLAIVTCGAVAVEPQEGVGDLAAGAVWGLVRAAQAEHPGRFVLVDLDDDPASREVLDSALALDEPQIAIRAGVARAARLLSLRRSGALELPVGESHGWRLDLAEPGTLDSLALVGGSEEQSELGAGQVRVDVRASGLNFRDVLIALDMYPGDASIGGEGAGVVTEVGPGVDDLAPGDRVMGLLEHAFSSSATADRRLLVVIPDEWSFSLAASIPIAFCTAYYGLVDLGCLRRGERVLVHAASGGVGGAALQLARQIGAEVFATAAPSKRYVLDAYGLDDAHVASSRTLDFKQHFLDGSGGAGMDVVLDCLAQEFVDASLAIVADGGRFLEMGKTDIRDPGEVRALNSSISYSAFDLREAPPERIQEILQDLLELFERGELQPSPIVNWSVSRAPQAFRFMSQARHVGKNVLQSPLSVRRGGTALITGGTGQLGAEFARHLVREHGVAHVLLLSRRGAQAPGAEQLLSELAELGASANALACDASDGERLREVIAEIPAEHPLDVVVHAAGVLDDGLLGALDAERVERVLRAKVDGAWNLHKLTEGLDVSIFAMCSSLAGTLGSPGQGSYAAANAFLDALAARRRAQGLPASSIVWGLWEQRGGMSDDLAQADLERMARSGVLALSQREGVELFDRAVRSGEPVTIAAKLHRGALRELAGVGGLSPLLGDLVGGPSARAGAAAGRGTSSRRLASMSEGERERVLGELVCSHTASVLGHASAERVRMGATFKELGFDSLAGVELRNRIARVTGLRLSSTLTFDYPTPAELLVYLLGELKGTSGDARRARAAVTVASDEPIAIVGMGCRYPGGVCSPEELWELVASGTDAICGVPEDRGWDTESIGVSESDSVDIARALQGGFLADGGEFDAEFFGIGPREALAMDPQQRLLLEVSWEAIERAGIDPLSLRNSDAGVFAGISASGYGALAVGSTVNVDGYRLTGNVTSAASGRIAYTLGLEGPALSIDTACSASLVALHLACQALRQGECSMALAGGAMVMASPELFLEFSRQGGLAGDGRCKAFSASADGTGWSEGAGMLLLERLSDAERLDHPVVALVRGSAVNQDGASNGLTAPNGPSQQRVIARALANAGLHPRQVQAVEAHGTGTTLGDPIEAQALIAAYGEDRDHPLLLGSLKSNIGHAVTAAGVGGVIKMAMALHHETLPRTLHVEHPSTKIDWSAGAVELLSEAVPWNANGGPRRAGVSSFGISGTNAHLILKEAPGSEEALGSDGTSPGGEVVEDRVSGGVAGPAGEHERVGVGERVGEHEGVPVPWVLSAKSEVALREQARRLLDHMLANSEQESGDIGLSLAVRPALERRAVVVGENREELLAGVDAIAAGQSHGGVSGGVASEGGKLVYLLSGQGAQRDGMGRGLYAAFPVFRQALLEVCEPLDRELGGGSLIELMFGDCDVDSAQRADSTERAAALGALDRTLYAQPALFAFELALFRLLESWGVKPDLLLGHSVGELVAAHLAGVLSLADACTLVVARGRLMDALPDGGAMVAVQASEEEALGSLAEVGGTAALAAVNAPAAVVLSGDGGAVSRLAELWRERGRKTRRLVVSHAFHSPRMDNMLADFASVARGLSFAEPRIPIVSNTTGEIAGEELCDPDYWVRHVRETVRFADGVRRCAAAGATRFLEIGPDGVLGAMVRECLPGEGNTTVALARANRPEAATLLSGLAQLWTDGAAVDWKGMLAARGARRVELPTYSFQRRRYWLGGGDGTSAGAASLGQRSLEHPLLGAAVGLAEGGGRLITARLSLRSQPWLADHVAMGGVLLPGTALVELALHAGGELGCASLRELTIEAPLWMPEHGGVQLQLLLGEPDEHGARAVSIHSRPEQLAAQDAEDSVEESWTRNAGGTLDAHTDRDCDFAPLQTWPPERAESLNVEDLYERLAEYGLAYGPAFQGVRAAWRRDEELFVHVALTSEQVEQAASFDLHPALLDATLHVAAAGADGPLLPFSWQGVELYATGARELHVRLAPSGESALSLTLADTSGAPVASIGALHLRPLPAPRQGDATRAVSRSLFALDWSPAQNVPASSGGVTPRWVALEELAPPTGAPLEDVRERLGTALELLRGEPGGEQDGVPLALVTERAVAIGESDGAPDLAGAAAWGLVRAAQLESPGRFVLVDVDGEQRSWEALPGALELALAAEEPQLALRGGEALVPRLARVDSGASSLGEAGPFLKGSGTVLITGGTGGLGALLAKHLVRERGVRRLLLSSRAGAAAPGAGELVEELSELGACARVVACDVSSRKQLKKLLRTIEVEHPLRAVVHAAGVLDDCTIDSLSTERLERVLAPKADGAWHLHELTAGLGLDAFVLFSSAAGTLGSPGQGNYAAANAFLDALAEHRRAVGMPAVSLAWGAWERHTGMTSELGQADRARIARGGVRALEVEQGLGLFDVAEASDRAVLVPMGLDRTALGALARAGTLPAPLRGIVPVLVRPRSVEGSRSLARLLGSSSGPERRRVVLELVRGEIAVVLGHGSGEEIETHRSFKELGFDSLAAVELRNRLDALTGLRLSATLVFDHPSPDAVADLLLQTVGEETRGNDPQIPQRKATEEPIAIVGMGCRYPGGVASPEDLWRLVADGVDAISPFPEDRGWDVQALYDPDPDRPGTSYATEGGFVADAGDWDCAFFGVSPREALAMDPQQRLLLRASWEALEDAGIDPRTLRGSPTGVFAGVMYQDYGSGIPAQQAAGLEGYLGTGGAGSVVSGRIAYTFGLEGPAVSVNTACSSSLVALHLACQALRAGECSMALAGGVTVMWTPDVFLRVLPPARAGGGRALQVLRRCGRRYRLERGRRRARARAAVER